MTPLKIASRAYVNHGGNGETYEAFREEDQREADEAMRAALLALSNITLPERMYSPDGREIWPQGNNGMYQAAYEIILRSIANEGKTDG